MTKIDDFCIDKYEASVIKSDGAPWSPYCDPQFGNVEVKAVSIKNGVPQSNINYVWAKKACENSGKRLCTDEEWKRACKGTQDNLFPYGATFQDNKCNDESVTSSSVSGAILANPSHFVGTTCTSSN